MSGSIPTCTITGSLRSLTGLAPGDLSSLNATLYIKNEQSFMYNDNLIAPFELTADFDGSGDVSLACMETETPGQRLNIFVTISEGLSTRTILFDPAIIPNTGTIDLGSLTQVRLPVW
jgi:hypothetical protein